MLAECGCMEGCCWVSDLARTGLMIVWWVRTSFPFFFFSFFLVFFFFSTWAIFFVVVFVRWSRVDLLVLDN